MIHNGKFPGNTIQLCHMSLIQIAYAMEHHWPLMIIQIEHKLANYKSAP